MKKRGNERKREDSREGEKNGGWGGESEREKE